MSKHGSFIVETTNIVRKKIQNMNWEDPSIAKQRKEEETSN